ncbi:MAG: HAD-IB family phosphatase [Blastocatellia bacterium]|nr:HAD-IB family phosphatase [Blastocatellia bacterium]
MNTLHLFSDFDGTITDQDTLIFLTSHLGGGAQMIEAIGRLIGERKLTLAEGIAAEMRSIRAPYDEAATLLREEVRIDPGFPAFYAWCVERRLPLTILSAGFRQNIELFLPPATFSHLKILANELRPNEKIGWQCVFRDKSEFGHDKAAALKSARKRGEYTVFVGDGLSDRAAAEAADLVFAKHSLAVFCRDRGIDCLEYETFHDVLDDLKKRFV